MLQVTAEREVVTLGYGTLLEPRGWLNAVVLVADPYVPVGVGVGLGIGYLYFRKSTGMEGRTAVLLAECRGMPEHAVVNCSAATAV